MGVMQKLLFNRLREIAMVKGVEGYFGFMFFRHISNTTRFVIKHPGDKITPGIILQKMKIPGVVKVDALGSFQNVSAKQFNVSVQ